MPFAIATLSRDARLRVPAAILLVITGVGLALIPGLPAVELAPDVVLQGDGGGKAKSLGKPLAPISQDAAAFYEDHVVIGDEAGKVAVEVKGGNKVANAFAGVKAAIHQNHGLLTASRHSIDSAAFWFIALERCCQQQLMIEATGITPKEVTPERARYSREHVGSEYIGWLHFQTIWNDLVATQPDMFD